MPETVMTIRIGEDSKIYIEGPPDFGTRFLMLAAAHEITMRQFIPIPPPGPASNIVLLPPRM